MAKQFYVDQLKDKNVIAFLKLIRFTEGTSGTNGYRTLFGGGLFNDLSKHPNIVINKSGYKSSAAGAYQILADTWNNQVKKGIGVSDFSETSQDLGAVYLINIQGKALDLVKQGLFSCSFMF